MSTVVKKKVKKVLSGASGRVSQQQIVTSLQQLNNLPLDAETTTTTVSLRRTVEERQVAITENVVAASEELIEDLGKLDRQVSMLNEICERIETSVNGARSAALPMLAERERLLAEQEKTNNQAEVLAAFNELFSVQAESLDALNHTVSPAFFKALQRVQAVHANCRMLLRSNHRRAGLELMDRMSNLQEKAYENLCRWVQSECNAAEKDGVSNHLLKQAIESLKSRPVLLKYCAEEVASSRHNIFFRQFLDALTKSQGPATPAIETYMNAQPVTYVRKICAWLSHNIQKEKTLFTSLFSDTTVHTLLDRVFEGICRPLKVRLDQVLMSTKLEKQEMYQICQTLEHYSALFGKEIAEDAALVVTTREAFTSVAAKFGQELKQTYLKLVPDSIASLQKREHKLAPPEGYVVELATLASILSSPGEGEGGKVVGTATSQLDEVLEQSVRILCDFCDKSASQVRKAESEGFFLNEPSPQVFPRGSHQMYLINCLQLLLKTLGKKKASKGAIEAYVETTMGRSMDSLVSIIVQGVMAERDLTEKIERIKMYEDSGSSNTAAMARDPALSADDLVATLGDIHTYLLQWLGGKQDLASIKLLQNSDTQTEAQDKVLGSLAGAYEKIFSALADPTNHYPPSAAKSIAHSPEYIKDLLKTITTK